MTGREELMRQFESICVRLSGSWAVALLVIFAVFAVAALLLDDFPIQADGLFSIATAGYFPETPNPLENLVNKSQQHVPAYFLLLWVWGSLSAWEPLALRLPSLYFGLLSLALIYRFGRDFISKPAGFLALVMLSSLTFYNIWYLPIRMYTLFVAAALLLLWLYFRLLWRRQAALRDYVLLTLAAVLFMNTHIFSLSVICGLAAYHLFFVRRTRRWYALAGAGLAAGLAFLPWLAVLIPGTVFATGRAEQILVPLSVGEMLERIIILGTNANLLFVGLLLLSLMRVRRGDRMTRALWVILIVAAAFYMAVNLLTGVIDEGRSRYLVVLLPLVILLLVEGLLVLARWRLLVVGIVLFWVAGGLLYHRRVAPDYYVRSYNTIPIHQIERHLRDAFRAGDLLLGWTNGLNFDYQTPYGGVADFYFAEHDITLAIGHTYQLQNMDAREISAALAETLAGRERVWLVYEQDSADYEAQHRAALAADFVRCYRDDGLPNVVIELHQRAGCD